MLGFQGSDEKGQRFSVFFQQYHQGVSCFQSDFC